MNLNLKRKDVIPNFVGGSLPRRDRGDREYYCATMLTLFKPWRTGKDLKDKDYSWDETFTTYKFTARQLQIMDYFNIRYECNDARDDYATQLKQNNATGLFSKWISTNEANDLNDYDSEDDFDIFDDDNNITQDFITNPYVRKEKAEMNAAQASVKGVS